MYDQLNDMLYLLVKERLADLARERQAPQNPSESPGRLFDHLVYYCRPSGRPAHPPGRQAEAPPSLSTPCTPCIETSVRSFMNQRSVPTTTTDTFVVRFWREATAGEARWRGRIEHVQSGESAAFLEIGAMLSFLRALRFHSRGPKQLTGKKPEKQGSLGEQCRQNSNPGSLQDPGFVI